MNKFLTFSLLGFALVGCGGEPVAEPVNEEAKVEETVVETPEVKAEESAPVEEVKQDKTFGITSDEYGKRFVGVAKDAGIGDFEWDGVDIKTGKVNDVFSVKLSDTIAKNGTIDKNGELKAVTYILAGTDNLSSDLMSLAMMTAMTARSLSPDMPKEKTGGQTVTILSDAITDFEKSGNVKGSSEKVIDGIKYHALVDKNIGIWFSFEPAD